MPDQPEDPAAPLPPAVRSVLAHPAAWEEPPPLLRSAALLATKGPRAAADQGRREVSPPRRRVHRGVVALVAAAILATVGAGVVLRSAPERPPAADLALADRSGVVLAEVDVVRHAAGWSMAVEAGRLPELPPGAVYELLVTPPGAGTTSAGTFRAGDGASLWSGVVRIGGSEVRLVVVGPGGVRSRAAVAAGRVPAPS